MTDLPPSWQPDPAGRHDHRYWDGTAWTDHVADAGVAATDPLEVPAPDAVAPQDDAAAPPEPTEAIASEPVPTGDATAVAPDPVPAVDTPAVDTAVPTADPVAAPDQPVGEAGAAGDAGEPTLVTSTWADPTLVEPATPDATVEAPSPDAPVVMGPSGDAPTVETPLVVGLPIAEVADAAAAGTPVTDAAPAWAPPPETPGGDAVAGAGGGGGGSRVPKLVIGIAVVAVLALVVGAVLLISGGGSSSDASTVASKIADRLHSEEHLSDKDAACVSKAVVDKLGAARLKGVDFTATQPPKGLEKDFPTALGDAIISCHVNIAEVGGSSSSTTTSPGINFGSLGDISSYKELLTNVYKSSFGLSQEKASCLAGAMTDAISKGKVAESQAETSTFFTDFLDHCHISLDDLNHTPGAG